MYQPTLGRFLSRDPLGPGGVDVLYDNNSFGERLTAMRNLSGYADGNPIGGVDPSGLRPNFGNSRACAGTDCDESEGIKTWNNPQADPSCGHPCKAVVVAAHEAEHRKNMKRCCDRRNQCLRFAMVSADVPNDLRARYKSQCNNAWNLWKAVNRVSLELRAGAESCQAAKWMITQVRNGMLGLPSDCCSVVTGQLFLCDGNDPTAQIEPCPFQRNGELDADVLIELRRTYDLQNSNR